MCIVFKKYYVLRKTNELKQTKRFIITALTQRQLWVFLIFLFVDQNFAMGFYYFQINYFGE